VTTALYYTPKGREIQEKGIPPDALVRQPGDKRNRDVVMERELRRNHEQKAKEQADSTAGEKVDSKTEEKPKSPPAEKKKVPSKPIILGSENDYQLSVARRILDEMPNRQVSNLMTRAREILNTPGPPQARAETPK
jgi:carboxyl-terminal processing protease